MEYTFNAFGKRIDLESIQMIEEPSRFLKPRGTPAYNVNVSLTGGSMAFFGFETFFLAMYFYWWLNRVIDQLKKHKPRQQIVYIENDSKDCPKYIHSFLDGAKANEVVNVFHIPPADNMGFGSQMVIYKVDSVKRTWNFMDHDFGKTIPNMALDCNFHVLPNKEKDFPEDVTLIEGEWFVNGKRITDTPKD